MYETFHRRQQRARGELPDVYKYDKIPQELKYQIIHILRDVLYPLNGSSTAPAESFGAIHDMVAREFGKPDLGPPHMGGEHNLGEFFLKTEDAEKVMSIVEIAFLIAQNVHGNPRYPRTRMSPEDGIDELNIRFRQHSVGYQFESNEIIRVDSQILHSEVVQPVLKLLSHGGFEGPNDEFLGAHDHYRHGRYEEAINECLKALESVLKVLCTKRNWTFDPNDTSKRLLDIVFENRLIPAYLQTEFSGVRAILESSVPTTRNRAGGHGQGATVREVPRHLASFVLHSTAANILLLCEADAALD
jgi:hypothetical protein